MLKRTEKTTWATDPQKKLKTFAFVIVGSIATLCITAVAAKPISVLLATTSALIVVAAAYIERKWLRLTPLPPLTAICVCGWLRSGVGGTLIALSTEESQKDSLKAMWDFLPETQILWLSVMAASTVLFAWKRPIQPQTRAPSWNDTRAKAGTLVLLAIACGVFALAWISIANIYGTLDRDPDRYLHWALKTWRPDSYFVIFARFRDIFFLAAPLAIQKASKWGRVSICTILIAYLALALPLGGRGLAMWPIIYLWFGLLITSISRRLLILGSISVIVAALTFLPAIQLYKLELQTAGAREGEHSRFESAGKAINLTISQFLLSDRSYWRDLGRPVYGCVDGLLFDKPASEKPRAGLARIENVLTAWIPGTLVRRSLPVRDAHLIAAEASGLSREEAERRKYTSHDCISFGGDLYWRAGWPGVILGSCGFAVLFRTVSTFWYRYAGNEKWWSILLMLYPATFLQAMPLGSLGETAWSWTWELPKYVGIVGTVYLLRLLVRGQRIH